MTPVERTLRARKAALTQWAGEPDRTARTASARAGLQARFERIAREKHPKASEVEIARYADIERRLFYADMTLKSMRARAAKSSK